MANSSLGLRYERSACWNSDRWEVFGAMGVMWILCSLSFSFWIGALIALLRILFFMLRRKREREAEGVVAGTRKGKRTHVPSASSLIMRTCLRSRYREFSSSFLFILSEMEMGRACFAVHGAWE